MNDTYLKTWNSIPPTIPQIFSAYLAKITKNLSLHRYEKNNAKKRGNGEFELVLDELSECLSDNNTVENKIEEKSVLEAIVKFLENENNDNRSMFVQRYFYNFSVCEIADNYNISKSNVTTTLYRMRNRLKTYLEKEGVVL